MGSASQSSTLTVIQIPLKQFAVFWEYMCIDAKGVL